MAFDLKDYEEVKDRIPKFREQYPEGRVITDLISSVDDLSVVVFRASLYHDDSDVPLSTGWAFEREGSTPVNRTSHLENCETSAIGRALANIGICGKNRPSREEMQKKANSTNDLLDKRRKQFFAKAAEAGIPADDAKETLKGVLGLASFNDATVEQIESGIRGLDKKIKEAAA